MNETGVGVAERRVDSFIENPKYNFWGSQGWSRPGTKFNMLVLSGKPERPGEVVENSQYLNRLPLSEEEAIGQVHQQFSIRKLKFNLFNQAHLQNSTEVAISGASGKVDLLAYSMGVQAIPSDMSEELIAKLNSVVLVNPFFGVLAGDDNLTRLEPLLGKLMDAKIKVRVVLSAKDKMVNLTKVTKKIFRGPLGGKIPIVFRPGDHGITITELREWWNELKDPKAKELVGR